MVTISPLHPDDRPAWEPLWAGYLEFYETDLAADVSDATFTALTIPGTTVHGAMARDDDGTPIGIVHWLTHASTWALGDYCYLEDLYVSPDARGTGAGRALIAHVRDWAAEHGAAKVYWLTAEGNTTARTLYDRVAADTGFVHYEIEL
ncbi:MAG: GNAT family N-acetyltransferase [Microbacterium ginsengisoli]|uniref:GNAT family N-acetyltransferase n=2 Tax=Microbacteriaceae TaxID=85023 RepID=UPI0006FFBF30|nr:MULTISPECIES: GNAT family N-acetyltransferase [unclassified Microbacterium]KQR90491.1 GNAT family acetyltransferase [Microbacterium sp. Leaf347]MBN9199282.1 GNAT family N-acetyltransferase [Microbacterium ginsengisoli]OJU74226.1 MAG: GNAT family N-acetyltransferase [Microbacterium sp. 71-23]